MGCQIKDGAVVLFQGDSVTDCGRQRDQALDLGFGYAAMIAAWYSALYPAQHVQFFNRGISGNRVPDLQARWQDDCLALKPDWLTILIGINDCWRRYDSQDPTSTEAFSAGYRALLVQTKASTDAQIILMEPFVLPTPQDRLTWREDLDPKIQVVRTLAQEFGATLIALDGLFAQATVLAGPGKWATDGVHPTHAGHALIARAWLETVGAPV